MGNIRGENKVPKSILEEILSETFHKLEDNEDFDSELISKLKNVKLPGTTSTERKLISILRGESQ